MSLRTTQDAALQPVRDAMVRGAAEHADEVVAHARAAAEAIADAAHDAARAAVADARAAGMAQAGPVAAAELTRSRQAARAVSLGAARSAHEEIAARIRTAVLALRDEPDYPQLREALAARAAHAAGPGARVTDHRDGGVVARAGGVLVDCSLPRLADRAIEALSARIAGLCER